MDESGEAGVFLVLLILQALTLCVPCCFPAPASETSTNVRRLVGFFWPGDVQFRRGLTA